VSPAAACHAADTFPARSARTRRFTLGVPRSLRVRAGGRGLLFLRSAGSQDPTTLLWALDLPDGEPRCVLDPRQLALDDTELPAAERARRERARETAGGIVAYATDAAGDVAVAAIGATAVMARVDDPDTTAAAAPRGGRVLALPGPVTDPRPDPTGRRVAWVRGDALWVANLDGSQPRELAAEAAPEVCWGLAEFVAAEEMGRTRGYWWAPDGRRLLAARVDLSPVATWHLGDPARPWQAPQTVRYPAAGQANAAVSLAVLDLDGGSTPVAWDAEAWPYLAAVDWHGQAPLLMVQTRDQRRARLLDVDPADGTTRVRAERTDAHWVELVAGLPRRLPDGRAVHAIEDGDARRLAIDGRAVGPSGVGLRRLVGLDGTDALIAAVENDPTATPLWRVPLDGGGRAPWRVTAAQGVHDGTAGHGVTVVVGRRLADAELTIDVTHPGGRTSVASLAATPPLTIRPRLAWLGDRELATALLLPQGHEPGDGPLPVLLAPYGGPHVQRVLQAGGMFATDQWFAEQGFAVLVVDGRGSPGRGRAWEQAVAGDLAGAPLADQVEALQAADARWPDTLDRSRVAIRGWSFGGFLAAQAVLRRPQVFHAAVAGAPVTEWRWYDTHYTERYLGRPDQHPARYDACGLLGDAPRLERPLLLIHGLADDNVVAAHTLQLSAALLAAGRSHRVLPLTGVTHMASAETVAANLLWLERDFLRDALA
jgi:dipeptidyl-peptidase-4